MLVVVAFALACGSDASSGSDASAGTSSTSTGSSGADPQSTSGVDSSGPAEGPGFIIAPDGGVANECDPWAQDCPRGEKCMPWANMRGSTWNATRCSPIDPMPGQPGDPCTVEGSDVSGIDDCALGAMCWDVDTETLTGVCVPLCMGSANAPVCEDPGNACILGNGGVLNVCLPLCDPLLQPCPMGQACYPISAGFVCGPDQSDDMGAYGDPCAFVNVCDPGLFCASADLVPSCASGACCTPYCDVTDPDASAACPGAAEGQACNAWFDDGEAPPGLEHVGACAIPQ